MFRFPRSMMLAATVAVIALPAFQPAAGYAYSTGDLVISIEGQANGALTLDQAGPIVLQEFTHNGTSSASSVGQLALPQTATTINGVTNYAVSGEFGSASEGLLQLSGNGKLLTIMGYGVNAAQFNANPAGFGSATGALGQTTSTAAPRVVATIDGNGFVDSSTGLTNVFNTQNPRSA